MALYKQLTILVKDKIYLGPSANNFSMPESFTYKKIIDCKIVGMDITIKFIKLGFVLSLRYFNMKNGKKMQGIIEDMHEINKITGERLFIKFLVNSF